MLTKLQIDAKPEKCMQMHACMTFKRVELLEEVLFSTHRAKW
jgi:hypothetical protein